jgi:hypothetical protein
LRAGERTAGGDANRKYGDGIHAIALGAAKILAIRPAGSVQSASFRHFGGNPGAV